MQDTSFPKNPPVFWEGFWFNGAATLVVPLMDRRAAEKLAQDLVQDILRRYGADIRRHNQVGDTRVVYGEVFEAARRLFKQATARHPIYAGYFDHYLHALILKDCITILPMGDRR